MATNEEEKEIKERKKVQREKLATFFYDLAKLSFAALVLGIISPILTDDSANTATGIVALFGLLLTLSFAIIAHKILN